MLGRLSLRARLVVAIIALAAAGLGVAGLVTYASLRSFLVERTDESLQDSHFGIERDLFRGECGVAGRPLPGASPGDFIQLRSPGNVVLCSRQTTTYNAGETSPPRLPATIAAGSRGDGPDRVQYFTVPAEDGASRYRVRASIEPRSQAILFVATPLDDVDATLRRLLLIEVLVTAAVLAALGALGLWVVRLGLRPLTEIESTAAAIAAGDLSSRVQRAEPRTEVGRLGMALNSMLGQIEAAFTAQAESERRLRRFVADASHELRTPLAAVRAYAELFSRGADRRPADLRRSMRGISLESERMSVLVDDLLLLARLDEGRPLEREPIELESVVGEAVEAARAVEPGRPIHFDADHARVLGDRDRLRQIVDNLLGNVRAHTPPGTPASVRVHAENGSGVIEVEDAGPGMSPEDAARAFERFYRADESRSRASGGVGLGLSIVAAVAEAHGGAVEARTESGRGATIRITLPLAAAGRSGPECSQTDHESRGDP
jgi:two-component system, OmpR family, sensor kinase